MRPTKSTFALFAALLLALLDLRQKAFAVRDEGMERIEFLMEARLYHAAFAHGKGRLLHNRGINEGEKIQIDTRTGEYLGRAKG